MRNESSIEISFKNIDDEYSLRLWKLSADIEGSPKDLFQCLMYRRYFKMILMII
jgi:hypothetical protein